MTIFYWLIPLFILAVAVAVIPVLYGTLKHQDWENREAALKESQRVRTTSVCLEGPAPVPERHAQVELQDARAEAAVLLRRIEYLTERIEGEAPRQHATNGPRPMATAGR
jgi:hypothetical protein